jgi:hypothetical protein
VDRMSTGTTTATTGEGATIANESESLLRRVLHLRGERDRIDQEVATILATLRGDPSDPRPEWGPCTRCAHVWRGKFLAQPPRCCPQCGSSGWNRPPLNRNARHPTDPPNPNWARRQEIKNRRTGRKPGRPRTRLRPGETTLPSPFVAPPPKMDDLVSVAPPPKLQEMPVRMVPSESVRFAQAREEPQPERTISVVEVIKDAWEAAVENLPETNITNVEVPMIQDDELAKVEAVVAQANTIPSAVSFRNDGPPREADTTDPSVDYVRVGNAWVPATQAVASLVADEQIAYEEAERGNDSK